MRACSYRDGTGRFPLARFDAVPREQFPEVGERLAGDRPGCLDGGARGQHGQKPARPHGIAHPGGQDALTGAGCGRLYTEKISTREATTERPGLTAALDYLRRGDTLVVWKLDRLGRSVKDVLTIADDLQALGIGVRILTGKLSGSYSPAGEGKFFFTMMAAFAELEREIIHERAMAGLAAAKAQGRNGGRPTVMDADKLAAARARRERGESPAKIARALGVSRASVYRYLAAESE